MYNAKKILIVVGTRPEAIKMAPIYHEFRKEKRLEIKLVITAQHREMLDQVLAVFDMKADYDLNIMKAGQTLSDVTSEILIKLSGILEDFNPDMVLVHGDTSTTLASALAAYYFKIPVGHVEAGLRTYNMYSPWPEEVNRRATASIATLHFAPTQTAKQNLLNEAIKESKIIITGNTVVDTLQLALRKLDEDKTIEKRILNQNLYPKNKRLILVTGHRRESFDGGFEKICRALREISLIENTHLVYPVHMNPNVKIVVEDLLGDCPNISLVSPMQYLEFVYLMSKSHIILTDSGGIQEEAPSLGVPVLVLRDVTERPEAVRAGTVKVVGTKTSDIVREAKILLESREAYEQMSKSINPYGDGFASSRILQSVLKYLNK